MTIERPLLAWKTIRVFISSTFRDMHGERDLLTKYVFPELRCWCYNYFLNLYEVDLRWGITERQSQSDKLVLLFTFVISHECFQTLRLGGMSWPLAWQATYLTKHLSDFNQMHNLYYDHGPCIRDSGWRKRWRRRQLWCSSTMSWSETTVYNKLVFISLTQISISSSFISHIFKNDNNKQCKYSSIYTMKDFTYMNNKKSWTIKWFVNNLLYRQLELCLSEVEKADIFVGMIGERYGWVPSKYNVEDKENLGWVEEMPAGHSMTQLEMLGFLRKSTNKSKALFLSRDPQFIKYIMVFLLYHTFSVSSYFPKAIKFW